MAGAAGGRKDEAGSLRDLREAVSTFQRESEEVGQWRASVYKRQELAHQEQVEEALDRYMTNSALLQELFDVDGADKDDTCGASGRLFTKSAAGSKRLRVAAQALRQHFDELIGQEHTTTDASPVAADAPPSSSPTADLPGAGGTDDVATQGPWQGLGAGCSVPDARAAPADAQATHGPSSALRAGQASGPQQQQQQQTHVAAGGTAVQSDRSAIGGTTCARDAPYGNGTHPSTDAVRSATAVDVGAGNDRLASRTAAAAAGPSAAASVPSAATASAATAAAATAAATSIPSGATAAAPGGTATTRHVPQPSPPAATSLSCPSFDEYDVGASVTQRFCHPVAGDLDEFAAFLSSASVVVLPAAGGVA